MRQTSRIRCATAVILVGLLGALGYSAGAAARAVRAASGGHGILYAYAPLSIPSSGYGGRIYLWQPGRPARRLTSGSDPRDMPQWSPDGRHVAFVMSPGWNGQGGFQAAPAFNVFVMRADGSDTRQVTRDGEPGGPFPAATYDGPVSWSPDGRRLVFEQQAGGVPEQLVVVSARGGKETRLRVGTSPAWGRDGIAYVGGAGSIFLLDPDTGRSRLLVPLANHALPSGGYVATDVTALAWSPSGDRLAAIVSRSPGFSPHISIYSSSGRRLASFSTRGAGPKWRACGVTWSPTGSLLLVTGSPQRPMKGGEFPPVYRSVYEIDANGTHWRRLPLHAVTCTTSWR